MNNLADIVDALAADLEPVAEAAPPPDPAFGSDLSCDDDLRADFGELDSDDPLLVAQASYRRLNTSRGVLEDDPDHGLDVRRWLHQPTTERQLRENEGRARSELGKDDRVLSVEVTLSRVGPAELELAIEGETATGTFTLTLAVTSADVLLKEILATARS